MSTACFCVMFCLGGQFFYSIPFYQLYPKLDCFKDGNQLLEECTPTIACDAELVDRFEIDWSDNMSLRNWMTELDLICEEPYKIGLIGAIYFVSYSFGSLMFTGMIDNKGRKSIVLVANLIHILCLIALVAFVDTLYKIYPIIFIAGLAYSSRSNVSYMYGSEFVVKS